MFIVVAYDKNGNMKFIAKNFFTTEEEALDFIDQVNVNRVIETYGELDLSAMELSNVVDSNEILVDNVIPVFRGFNFSGVE